MARLTRYTQSIFGSTAGTDQIAQFGSLAASAPAFTTSPATIQALSQYLTGWYGAVIEGNSPAIEDMNALCYLYAYQLAYLMQVGVAEWDSGTTYYTGDIAQDGTGVIYVSIANSNTNHALSNGSYWKLLIPVASPTLAGIITTFVPTVASSVNNLSNANYAMTATDGYKTISVTTGGSARTVTLPPPASCAGREINIKKIDSAGGTILIAPNGSENIDGASSVTLYDQWSWLVLYCDGTNWFTISSSENYTSGSTFTFTGTTGQPATQTTRISKVGSTVTIALNFSSVTISGTTTLGLTGMPSRFIPATAQFVGAGYTAGSPLGYPTSLQIAATTGTITIYKDNTANFSNTNTAASPNGYLTFTYLVN